MRAGGLLGALSALALTAIYYLFAQIAGLPFVPFDLFDQLSRALPGGIITVFIEIMVRVIRWLNLGPTADVAKLIEQSMAVALAALVGAIFGVLLANLLRRRSWSGGRAGAIGGFLLFLVAVAVEIGAVGQTNQLVAIIWIAATTIGWGALLGLSVEGALRHQAARQGVGDAISRRAFLARVAAGTLAVAVTSFGLGRAFQDSRRPAGSNRPLSDLAGTSPPSPPPPVPGRTVEAATGTRPELTPNDQFYRIDIDLIPPAVHEDSWAIAVDGLFDRPRRLALSDLIAYPSVTVPLTLSCISNPVGGDLIGNAYWTGLRVADLMRDLGLRPEATGLRIESADGFYEIVTRADLADPRTLLVYGMNGQTLPVDHGFPLRILIPNRYGMKQPKWITRFTAMDREEMGYWVVRGWSREARPQTVSVIDTAANDREQNGRLPLGGIAWAGDRGIQRVEVQVDDGQWAEATVITPPLGPLAWVQWRYEWQVVRGRHTFRVRATDGSGVPQIEEDSPPDPEGATGYHLVTVVF